MTSALRTPILLAFSPGCCCYVWPGGLPLPPHPPLSQRMEGGSLLDHGRGKINLKPLCPSPMPTFSEARMPGTSESSPILGPAWHDVRRLGPRLPPGRRFPNRVVCEGLQTLGKPAPLQSWCSCLAQPARRVRCRAAEGQGSLTDVPGRWGSRVAASGPSALQTDSKASWMSPTGSLSPTLGVTLTGTRRGSALQDV